MHARSTLDWSQSKIFLVQHIIRVCSNICPICQQAVECPMQRMMLAAVPATDERLLAQPHFMQISVHLSFSLHQTCTVRVVKHPSPCTG